ncbi:MAG TPA: hypothetical protein VGT40_21760 [Methylomirabilota bacterium]|nr:hypothetical protein [Methylomirabilota bacterium]
MTQAELLRYLAETLEGLGVDYMVGGSHAAMYYGEPRLTRDVDVVVSLHRERLPALLQRFPADEFYVDADAAREAVDTSGQFNIIHPGSGLKVDVYVNPDTPYDRARLARRQRLPLAPGVDAYFARPEDVILYKLLYAREGGELHLRDVLGIIRVSGPDLDERYVVEWAERLGVRAVWERVRRQAG